MTGMKRKANAFTLIEILVVIAIIGALTGILLPNFMAARERSRDAQRKSDLKQLQKALELYKLDQNPPIYVTEGSVANTFPSTGSTWSSGSTVYMRKVPGDPKTITPTPYSYDRTGTGITYVLCACLENRSDPDGAAGNCAGYTCSSNWKYEITEP